MFERKAITRFAVPVLMAASAYSLPAQERMRAGMWENTVVSDGRTASNTHCITPAEAQTTSLSEKAMREATETALAKGGKGVCTLKEFHMSGNTRVSQMQCGARSISNTTTYHGDSIETVTIITDAGVSKKSVIKARRVGDCP